MKIDKNELVELLSNLAKKVVGEDGAKYFAEEIIETQIRKAPRTNPIKSAITDVEASIKHADKKIEYAIDVKLLFFRTPLLDV